MKIIIATTFREFNNNENSKIQDLFLKSIEDQDYKNFSLAITIFKEKNIQKHFSLKYQNLDAVFFRSEIKMHRFSLSDVLLNAISMLEKNSILLWTTCDVIFNKNFFKKIIENYSPLFFGTSHPHVKFSSIQNFKYNKFISKDKIEDGIDTIFFDSNLFSKNTIELIKKYKFYDWGVFENFLTALGVEKSSSSLNLYKVSKIKKIENNRSENKETEEWLNKSWSNNKITMDKYIKDNNINGKYYNMTYCNQKYRMINPKFKFL